MKKLLSVLLVLVLIFSLAACTKNEVDEPAEVETPTQESTPEVGKSAEEESHYPVTISNFNYAKEPVEYTYKEAPKKVLAVYQNSIETLLALGLEDHIVGAAGLDHEVKPEFEDAFKKVNYLTEYAPDRESTLMLKPDMILSWYSFFGEKKLGDVDFWHERNIGTYMMRNSGAMPRALENEYLDILDIGKIFNVEEKAQALVDEMKAKVEDVAEKTKSIKEKPTVLMMEFGKDAVRVYGDNTLGGDMIKALGANLVTANENRMSNEQLIESNPDVIFSVYFGGSKALEDANKAVESLTKDPKFASLKAVQNGRVYPMPLGESYCSGVRTLDGIVRLAEGIYPEEMK